MRRWLLLFAASMLALSSFCVACESPPPPEPPKPPAVAAAPYDQGAELAPKITVKLSGFPTFGAPELINGEVAALYTNKQVILIPITITNGSDKEIDYTPLVNANGSVNESIPIRLIGTPDLEVKEGSVQQVFKRIAFVDSKAGAFFLPEQITNPNKGKVPAGGSINDVIVFDIPENIATLKRFILTIPGNIVTVPGAKPSLVALDLNFGAEKFVPIERKMFSLNEWAKQAPIEMRVTKVTPGPVLLVSRAAKKGEPDYENPKHRTTYDLLKVEFEVKNTGKEAIKYKPIHDKDQVSGLTLEAVANDESREVLGFASIRDSSLVPKDQISSRFEEVAPGGTLKDFFIFDLPDDDIRKLEFFVSAHLLDPTAHGLLRFQLKYDPPAAPPPPPTPPPGDVPPPTEPPK